MQLFQVWLELLQLLLTGGEPGGQLLEHDPFHAVWGLYGGVSASQHLLDDHEEGGGTGSIVLITGMAKVKAQVEGRFAITDI